MGREESRVFDSRHIDLAVGPLDGSHHFGAELELEALLLQDALEILGHLHVDAEAAHVAQEFHRRDFRAQSLPHRPLQDGRMNVCELCANNREFTVNVSCCCSIAPTIREFYITVTKHSWYILTDDCWI